MSELPQKETRHATRPAKILQARLPKGHGTTDGLTLHYGTYQQQHGLFIRCSFKLASLIRNQLTAAYPATTIQKIDETALSPRPEQQVHSVDLRLVPDVFGLQPYSEFEDRLVRERTDPVGGILSALHTGDRELTCRIDLTFTPATWLCGRWCRHCIRLLESPRLQRYDSGRDLIARGLRHQNIFVRLFSWIAAASANKLSEATDGVRPPDQVSDAESAIGKVSQHLFKGTLRLYVFAEQGKRLAAEQKLSEMAAAFAPFVLPGRNSFAAGDMRTGTVCPATHQARRWTISSAELASLWHPPTRSVQSVDMKQAVYRRLEPPAGLPRKEEDEIATLGRTDTLHHRESIGLRLDDRRRHLAIVGKTGMGKSTLLHNLITDDINAGRGVILIDPHGDLAEQVIATVPRRRTADVAYFDAGDTDFPFAFNPLNIPTGNNRALAASGIVSSFRKLYAESWGPRLEHILRNAVLALLETPDTTLISLHRMLFDTSYCQSIVNRVSDPAVAAFWNNEWSNWKHRFRHEAIAPVLNKIGAFLTNPILRSILGQPRNRLNLRRLMDSEQVLIVNLSKGRIGEDASNLLGAFLVSRLQLVAMSRADVAEEERPDCFCYVDELQNFTTESFITILSEARKYRLNLSLSHQYLGQLTERDGSTAIRDAVFGNVGSLLAFQVGARDAAELAEQFAGSVTPTDLIQLPKYHAYLRMLINGAATPPFSMVTLPPAKTKADRAEIIRRQSRQRYCQPAQTVHQEVRAQFHHAV